MKSNKFGNRIDPLMERMRFWEEREEDWNSFENNTKNFDLKKTFPYTVEEGDTLDSIASKFNTTVDILLALNSELKKGENPVVGTVIQVPLVKSDHTINRDKKRPFNSRKGLDQVPTKDENKGSKKVLRKRKKKEPIPPNELIDDDLSTDMTDLNQSEEDAVTIIPENANDIVDIHPEEFPVVELNQPEVIDEAELQNNVDLEYGKDVSWKTALTADQKTKYSWDEALAKFKEVNPGVGSTTLAQWTRKAISQGWRIGDPVPDIREIKVTQEGNIRYYTAYSYDDAYKQASKDRYMGYWYWIRPIGETKGSTLMKFGAITEYNNKHHDFSVTLINKLFWISKDRTLYKEALESGELGPEFIKLVKDVQSKLFLPAEDHVTGIFDPTTVKRLNEKVAALEKIKKNKIFVEVGSGYKIRVFDSAGVNLRTTPYTEMDPGYPGDNFIELLPYGTLLTVISQTPDLTEDSMEGWYYVKYGEQKGYVAKHLVRKTPAMDPDARLYKVKEGDQALTISFDHFDGSTQDHIRYIRFMLEMNKGAGIQLEPGYPLDPNFYKHVKVLTDFNIWIPSYKYAYDKSVGKIDDINDLIEKEKQIETLLVYATEKEALAAKGKFVENLNIIRLMSTTDVDKFMDETGTNWTNIVSALVGPITFGLNYLREEYNWQKMNSDFEAKYAITADDIVNTLLYFRQLAVADGFGLLRESQDFAEKETTKLKDVEYVDQLFTVVTTYKQEYLAADMLRAGAIFKYFDNAKVNSSDFIESIKKSVYSVWLLNLPGIYYDAFKDFYDKKDKKGLAKFLTALPSNTAQMFIFTFEYLASLMLTGFSTMISIAYSTDLQQKIIQDMASRYPEIAAADKKDEETHRKRLDNAENKDKFRILLDPNIDWRALAYMDSPYKVKYYLENYLKEVRDNCISTRTKLLHDPDLVWELKPLLQYTMAKQGILPESNFGKIVSDKYQDVEFDNTLISIGLAVLSIALAIAGFFTGGLTWGGLVLIGAGLVVSGIDFYRELKSYQFHSAASKTGVADIQSLSDKNPSIWGVVLALLGLGLDVVDIFKATGKLFKALEGLNELNEAAKFDEIWEIVSKADPQVAAKGKDLFIETLKEATAEARRLEGLNPLVTALLKKAGIKEAPPQMVFAYSRMYNLDPDFTKSILRAYANNPGMIIRYGAIATENHAVLNLLPDLARSIAKESDPTTWPRFAEVFTYLGSEGQRTLDILPTLTSKMKDAGITDPDLIASIMTNRNVQDVLLGEDKTKLPALWKSWVDGGKNGLFETFVKNQNLSSVNKTTEVLVQQQKVVVLTEIGSKVKTFKETWVNGAGSIKITDAMTNDVADIMIDSLRNGDIIKGGPDGFVNFFSKQLSSVIVEKISKAEYESILRAVLSKDPDLFVRKFLLNNINSVSTLSIKKLTELAQSGEVGLDTLQTILLRAGDRPVDEVIDEVHKLVTDKPAGWKDTLEEMAGQEKKVEVETKKDVIFNPNAKIVPKSVDDIRSLLKTEPGTAFFWSGKTNGIGGEIRALEVAETKGGITLEGLLKKNNIELPAWDPSNKDVMKIWEDVSAEYALQVSGEVRAVVGKTLRPGNIWETKELPALMSNTNVTKITIIDPETLIETIIFTR